MPRALTSFGPFYVNWISWAPTVGNGILKTLEFTAADQDLIDDDSSPVVVADHLYQLVVSFHAYVDRVRIQMDVHSVSIEG